MVPYKPYRKRLSALAYYFVRILRFPHDVTINDLQDITVYNIRLKDAFQNGELVERAGKYLSKINYIFATKLYENIFHGIN